MTRQRGEIDAMQRAASIRARAWDDPRGSLSCPMPMLSAMVDQKVYRWSDDLGDFVPVRSASEWSAP